MMSTNAGDPKFLGNEHGLKELETTYDVRRLNKAKEEGLSFTIVPINRNPELELRSLLLKNRETGEFEAVPSRAFHAQYTRFLEYPEDEWELVHEVVGYGRTRDQSQNWGAYIIPKDLEVGEKVYIPDLIQDIVATSHWYNVWPAGDAIATWDGQHFKIDHTEYYEKFHLVG